MPLHAHILKYIGKEIESCRIYYYYVCISGGQCAEGKVYSKKVS